MFRIFSFAKMAQLMSSSKTKQISGLLGGANTGKVSYPYYC